MEEEDEPGWDCGVVLPIQGSTSQDTNPSNASLHALPESILLAILSCLSAKELASAACCSRLLRTLATKDTLTQATLWRGFFIERWKVSDYHASHPWHALYGAKVKALKCWSGRPEQDQLHGHRSAVRAVKLLPRHNLLATASLDKTVRLWDLASGVCLSVSKPHGGTVRCLALDSGVLASGCSDHLVRVWLPVAAAGKAKGYSSSSRRSSTGTSSDTGCSSGSSTGGDTDGQPLVDPLSLVDDTIAPVVAAAPAARSGGASSCACIFDLSQPASHVLSGHRGPVDALCLSEHALYSGSWDYSVRIWSRHTWECLSVLTYDDWVVSVASRGGHLLVAAGTEVYVHELQTGQIVRKFQNLHEGHVTCIEGSQNGRILFTGSTDGLVLGHDLRMREASVVLWHANVSINCLSYEDPWLACACADGSVVMINTEVALGSQRGCGVPAQAAKKCGGRGRGGRGGAGGDASSYRQLSSGGGPAYSVDIAEQYLACGSESDVVKVWNFTHAAEAAERQAAAKAARSSARAARKQQHQQRMMAAAAGGGGAKAGSGLRGRQVEGGGDAAGVVRVRGTSPPHSHAVPIHGQGQGGQHSSINGGSSSSSRYSGFHHHHHNHHPTNTLQGSYGHSPGSSGTSPVMTHSFWPYASHQSPYSQNLPLYVGSYDPTYHHQYTAAAAGCWPQAPGMSSPGRGRAAGGGGGGMGYGAGPTSRHHHHQGSHRSAIAPLHLARSPGSTRQCARGSSSFAQTHSTACEAAAGPSTAGAGLAPQHGVADTRAEGGSAAAGSWSGQRRTQQQANRGKQRQDECS